MRARASRFQPSRLSGSMEASRLALAAITSAGAGDEAGAGGAAAGWAGKVGAGRGLASEVRSRMTRSTHPDLPSSAAPCGHLACQLLQAVFRLRTPLGVLRRALSAAAGAFRAGVYSA